jgi:murein DD-endopeptidase MepM/ murein hydrolase activator NlpD
MIASKFFTNKFTEDIAENIEITTEKIEIRNGDTLATTLNNAKLTEKGVNEIIKELSKLMDINKCSPGDFCEILYDKQTGDWTRFCYYPQEVLCYSIIKTHDNIITAEVKKLETTVSKYKKHGTIMSSLWAAMTSKNIPWNIITSFTDIFAWQIDFTDLKQGDTFKIVYKVKQPISKNKKLSKIIAAQCKTSSRIYNAFYFKTKEGIRGYFDEEGKSVKSAFLKAPLQFKRISSCFTTSRMHPILKYARPHLGIDYAAAVGTPVSSICDGVVAKANYSGGFGNLVIIKHLNGYETYYGHLSKFGKGIKKGSKVRQGQIIGYVGMTGLATGPHLDFRIKFNGKFLNFLKIKQPPTRILKGENKKAFEEKIGPFLTEFRK